MKNNFLILPLFLLLYACNGKEQEFDASGTFEAEETIVAAEASGALRSFAIEEGQLLQQGAAIGYIDSTQLYLKKQQLLAQINAIKGKKPDIQVQLAALKEQLSAAEKEQRRLTNLVKADAATTKQLDDMTAQVAVIKRQIAAQQSSLDISSNNISQETVPLEVQISQVNDQLAKSRIINPVTGTVLTKYAEENEITAPAKPLYRIADLSFVTLRAYVTADQLSRFKTGQQVKVYIDNGPDQYKEYAGTVTWVNDKAEFTPKTVQTKNERANLVYAIKVKVKNDGYLKLGMYGEVKF